MVKQEKERAQSHLKTFTVLFLWLERPRGQSDLPKPLLLPRADARLPVERPSGSVPELSTCTTFGG